MKLVASVFFALSLALGILSAQAVPATPGNPPAVFFELAALSRLHPVAVGGAEIGFYLECENRTSSPVSVLAYLPRDGGDYGEVRREDAQDTLTDWQVVQPGKTLRIFVNRTLPLRYFLRAADLNGATVGGEGAPTDIPIGGKGVGFNEVDAVSQCRDVDGVVVCRHVLRSPEDAKAAAAEARRQGQRALEAYKAKRLGEAREAIQAALQADPGRAEYHWVLGRIELSEQREEQAAEAFRACLARNPVGKVASEAAERLGALTLRRTVRAYNDGHLDEARKAVREALALRPDHAHSYFVLGNIEVQAKRYAEAEQALQAYLAREPQGKYAEKARKTLSDLSRVREQGTR